MYTLHRTIKLDCTQLKAWSFISRPQNLNLITPSDMNFQMVSTPPDEMVNGLLLEYKVNIPVLGPTRWVSEIKHIDEGRSFVDEQRFGPYAFWYHYHVLEPVGRSVQMTDEIHYQVPYGLIGTLANQLFVRRTLDRIFDYREKILPRLLGSREENVSTETHGAAA